MKDAMDEGDRLDLRWPKPQDRAFLEAHPFRGAWAAKATDERLYRMIKGFKESGDLIIDQTIAEPHRGLNLLYPAIFNYRQSLELRLKYLLIAYGPLVNQTPDFKDHSLQRLWVKCRNVIMSIDPKATAEEATFLIADKLVAEFDAIDPGSDAFRFAHDTKGRSMQLGISEIDLPNLRSVLAGLHNFLECIDCHLQYTCGLTPCSH